MYDIFITWTTVERNVSGLSGLRRFKVSMPTRFSLRCFSFQWLRRFKFRVSGFDDLMIQLSIINYPLFINLLSLQSK